MRKKSATLSPTIDLVARDLADAHAHIGEALALIVGRVPDDIINKLSVVSISLWATMNEDARLERVA
jgi:hypothetical protein